MIYTVEYGVQGAYRIKTKQFDSYTLALAFAQRWYQSNSTGEYWASIFDPYGALDKFRQTPEQYNKARNIKLTLRETTY